MTRLATSLVFALIAALMAVPAYFMYNKMPEAWLQDYDFDPNAKNFRLAKRLKPYHIALFAVIYAVIVGIGAYLYPNFLSLDNWIRVTGLLLLFPGFTIIIMSDSLNRIIPDHIIVLNACITILYFVADFTCGNIWIDSGKPWYYFVLNRVFAGLLGAGILFLIGWLSSVISKQEAMGFGDVKLLLLCGLLSGLKGLIFVFFISFVAGGIVAVPLFIRKRIRIAKEEKAIRESDNPAKARKLAAKKKLEQDFADNPDVLSFGPFLVLGTGLFLVFEPLCLEIFNWYFGPLLGA